MISTLAMARIYYVAPNGTDGSYPTRGTQNAPWRSWHYAMNHVTPGDTVYFRGGIYDDYYSARMGVKLQDTAINGTFDNYTCFFADPNDWANGSYPILDCNGMYSANNYNVGVEISRVNYIHFKGLTVRNVPQTYPTVYGSGYGFYIYAENRTTNPYRPGTLKFENCIAHNVPADGFKAHAVDTAYFINCDSYNNMDTLTTDGDVGGQGTGFNLGTSDRLSDNADACYISLFGCRAWNCSDQGYAVGADAQWVMENCWSFNNGNNPLATNDTRKGSGIKLWYTSLIPGENKRNELDVVQVIIRNCLFVSNAYSGINWCTTGTPNRDPEIRAHIYNNFIYNNIYYVYNFSPAVAHGYGILDELNDVDTLGRWDHRYWNNISYFNSPPDSKYDNINGVIQPDRSASYNQFDIPGSPVRDTWFMSLDTTGMLGVHTRKPDGSLPDTDFGKPAPGSPLIDAGFNVSEFSEMEGISPLLYEGSAPDIGWAEYTSGIPAEPTFLNAVIENAAPSRISITYNLTLTNIIPATSAFTVTVNGSVRAVSTVSVSGTKVVLALANPVVYGDVVTVAYTKPASNPLQTVAGGQAISYTARNVTNNVAAVTPVYVSSVVENATPARIDVTFNLTLANVVPAASAFTVSVNGSVRTVSSVTVSGSKVLLTLASPVVYGNTVSLAYTKPAANPLQTTAGGQAASFSARSVTNNVGFVNQPPIVNISSPTKSTSFVAPATITIEAVASDPDGPVSKVEFYQGAVKLGELTSAPYSYTWKEVPEGTYSITAAATDSQGLRTVSASVTVIVEKSSTQVNQRPIVGITISNRKKPKKHDNIVIVAEASDPDGTIAKVELKNGEAIIAEMTTAPYEFTLRDVDTGTYHFTAIATDNLGATTTSETLDLRIDDSYGIFSEIVRLYPNPNEGLFKLDILTELPEGNNRLSVFNSSGMIIYNERLTKDENPIEIDLGRSASGTYILMLTSGNTIISTKKFIIK